MEAAAIYTPGLQAGWGPGKRICRPLAEIHYHPSWIESHLDEIATPSTFCVFGPDPIPSVTRNGVLLNGYDLYESALRAGESAMLCLVFDLSDEEALEWIIKASRDHSALIPFNRIVLAINYVRTKYGQAAKDNQRTHTEQGWTKLSKADRIHQRPLISELAHSGLLAVDKASAIHESNFEDIKRAVRRGEISMSKAAGWLKAKDPQLEYELDRRVKTALTIAPQKAARIVSTHSSAGKECDEDLTLEKTRAALANLNLEEAQRVEVRKIDVRRPILLISKELCELIFKKKDTNCGAEEKHPAKQIDRNTAARQEVLGFSGTES